MWPRLKIKLEGALQPDEGRRIDRPKRHINNTELRETRYVKGSTTEVIPLFLDNLIVRESRTFDDILKINNNNGIAKHICKKNAMKS